MSLLHINSVNLYKIHEFTEKLLGSVHALETMGKLKETNGYLRLTLDKLQGIRADLVRMDNGWQEWKFPQLVDALESWTRRNPITLRENKIDKSFKSNQFKVECVYCDQSDHKSAGCEKVKSVSDRRKILSEKRLCPSCTGTKHPAANCRSNRKCLLCKCKHHTSICEKHSNEISVPMLASTESSVTYPVVIIKVNGIICRALLDTGCGSSYASEAIIDPIRNEYKTIETLTNATTKKLKIHSAKVQVLKNVFSFTTELNKLESEVLLTLPNPKFNNQLRGVNLTYQRDRFIPIPYCRYMSEVSKK